MATQLDENKPIYATSIVCAIIGIGAGFLLLFLAGHGAGLVLLVVLPCWASVVALILIGGVERIVKGGMSAEGFVGLLLLNLIPIMAFVAIVLLMMYRR